MESEQLIKPKRVRTKKRKVKRGLNIGVRCYGKIHNVMLTPKGHVVLTHHTDEELEVEMALAGIGGSDKTEICGCASFLRAWKTRKGIWDNSIVPTNIAPLRTIDDTKKAADRISRRVIKHSKYTHKHQKRTWFKDFAGMQEFVKAELDRYGMEYLHRDIKEVPKPDTIYGKAKLPNHSGVAYLECRFHSPGNLFIKSMHVPGLGAHRIFNKTNFDVGLSMISSILWASVVRNKTNDYKYFNLDAYNTKTISDLNKSCKSDNIETDTSNFENISYTFNHTIHKTYAVSYVMKKLEEILSTVDKLPAKDPVLRKYRNNWPYNEKQK